MTAAGHQLWKGCFSPNSITRPQIIEYETLPSVAAGERLDLRPCGGDATHTFHALI